MDFHSVFAIFNFNVADSKLNALYNCIKHVFLIRFTNVVSSVLLLQVLAQLQTQQGGTSLPQHIKLQLPIQIQQTGPKSAQGGQVMEPVC